MRERVRLGSSARQLDTLSVTHDEQLAIGHFLDGEAHAFATEPGVARAAVGHRVDAEAGAIVDDEAADLQAREGFDDASVRVGEDAWRP